MVSEPTALNEWASIIAAHKEARRDYLALLVIAQSDLNQQDEADGALRRLMALEAFALRQPATSPASFRFKLQLWADGRVDGLEQEWKIFSGDCERLLEKQATRDTRRTRRL